MLAGGCGGPAASSLTATPSSSAPALAAAGAGASVVSAPATTQASAFAREYARLHGVTPVGTLSTVVASQAEIVATIRSGYTGDRLLLPSTLPPGYALAAPFRGTGSGTPLPNPHTWESGYAVTYTDENGRLTLVVQHPDEPFANGEWRPTDKMLDGGILLVQERAGLVLVSTGPGDDAQVVVVGERLSRAEVLRVALGLTAPE